MGRLGLPVMRRQRSQAAEQVRLLFSSHPFTTDCYKILEHLFFRNRSLVNGLWRVLGGRRAGRGDAG